MGCSSWRSCFFTRLPPLGEWFRIPLGALFGLGFQSLLDCVGFPLEKMYSLKKSTSHHPEHFKCRYYEDKNHLTDYEENNRFVDSQPREMEMGNILLPQTGLASYCQNKTCLVSFPLTVEWANFGFNIENRQENCLAVSFCLAEKCHFV